MVKPNKRHFKFRACENLEMIPLSRHCVKSVRIWSYSGPYFPAFGLTTERYGGSLRI